METGTELNHYRILGPLGEGGMGQVYRAEDTRLRREVAIKVLPAELAADPERLARLEREAQLLARLEHPNVAAVYGLEESGATRFLVMQLVEGETLADRIAERSLTVDAVIPVALQIAEGLEAAHERGIVHRDLKPANIMVTPEGAVRILDFGLAKGAGPGGEAAGRATDLTASPTMLAPTQAGMILGTAAYMSPEQARGRAVDKRTDVWAFGCVLYEMLVAEPAFGGETVTDILAGIVHREPDLERLPAATPRRLRRLLERCLEKDPLRRLRDIGEARISLERALREPEAPVDGSRPEGEGRLPAWVLGGWAVTAAAGALLLWLLVSGAPDPQRPTNRLPLPPESSLNVFDRIPQLSPDGRRIVYHDGTRLVVRDLSDPEPRPLLGTEDATFPFWSHDSRQVGFIEGGRLWRMGVDRGEREPVSSVGEFEGGWWGEDDRIVFADDFGLWTVPARGGDPEPLLPISEVPAEGLNDLHYPHGLPDGAGVLFRAHYGDVLGAIGVWDGEEARLLLVPSQRDERLDDATYSPTGHLLYTRSGTDAGGAWAVPFDLGTLDVTGQPFLLYPGSTLGGLGADGSLLLVEGLLDFSLELAWAERDGTAGGTFVGGLPVAPPFPRIAPDGERVAVQLLDGGSTDIWLFGRDGARQRVTADPGDERYVAWDPASGRLAYERLDLDGTSSIWLRDPESDTPAREIATGGTPTFTPDGETLVYSAPSVDGNGGVDLWRVDLAGGDPTPLFSAPGDQRLPSLSPDGRWVAYVSLEEGAPYATGRPVVEVRTFPGGVNRRVLSPDLGWAPRWSPDGRDLYFLEPGTGIVAVPVAVPEFGAPEVVVSPTMRGLSGMIIGNEVGYDVHPANGRFLIVGQTAGDSLSRLVLVQNWESDLNARR